MPWVLRANLGLIVLASVGTLKAGDQPTPVNTADEMKANVGKLVAVEGTWSDRGKLGPFVTTPARQSIQVSGPAVQENRLYGLWDERRVKITGRLRFFEIPAAKRA